MQNSSAFQYLAIHTIHESTTNPLSGADGGYAHGHRGSSQASARRAIRACPKAAAGLERPPAVGANAGVRPRRRGSRHSGASRGVRGRSRGRHVTLGCPEDQNR